jgi:hypothetical protein
MNAETQVQSFQAHMSPARCRWCIERTGAERYRFMGVWQAGLCVPLKHTTFTDTICPECQREYFAEYLD